MSSQFRATIMGFNENINIQEMLLKINAKTWFIARYGRSNRFDLTINFKSHYDIQKAIQRNIHANARKLLL